MVTALILVVPEAAPLVSPWRERYDPSARDGVPPHVTVLVPFKPNAEIDERDTGALRTIFAACPVLDLSFHTTARFPGTLWLSPEPTEPIRRLTLSVTARFSDYLPYEGAFADVVPHLTVAQAEESVLDGIEKDLRIGLAAPIRSRVRHCSLYSRETGGWRHETDFPLGT